MVTPNVPEQRVLSLLLQREPLQSSMVHDALIRDGEERSLVTVKRLLSGMAKRGLIAVSGKGRSTAYSIATTGRLLAAVDAARYCSAEPDARFGLSLFNRELLEESPNEIFTEEELHRLGKATEEWRHRTRSISKTIAQKEMERLVIELSWKSSKIEGNTYTLLDTERLVLRNTAAPGHDKNEATMILNHKEAFTLIHDHRSAFCSLTRSNLEHLHGALVQDLGVGRGLRSSLVGVTGSRYRPLDNIHQITDAINLLCASVNRMETPYAQSLFALLGISYIQPFEDGNKRTSRLMANALLLAHNLAPLSYRSVNEEEYREAMLVFYELNSLVPMKKIFLEQYEFAAENYAVR
jgi:fido (protein-threonine AMPylation protein)